jgi:hypothetical protein
MHFAPSTVALCVGSDLRHRVINDSHRLADERRVVTLGVGCLVDPGQSDEGKSRPLLPQSERRFFPDQTVDL